MPVRTTVPSTDDVMLAVHDFGGDGPDLILCHATGMHGMVWAPVVEFLIDRFRCVAFDFRGHGDSTMPESGSMAWTGMTEDLAAVVDAMSGSGPRHGAGWSMGGCALIRAGIETPGLWRSAWVMEPIIFSAIPVAAVGESRGNLMAQAARRRREVFADRDEAFTNYASKPPFSHATPTALHAYVDHGFEDRPDGSVRLKCRGETEARVFEQSVTDTADRLAEFPVPMTVVASGDGMPPALVAPEVADQLPGGALERMDDLSHFAPMEDPARVAASIVAALS
ncbi:MAG: alpha/beta fold hydrolase [Acidimicrobiales bacterium]